MWKYYNDKHGQNLISTLDKADWNILKYFDVHMDRILYIYRDKGDWNILSI